MSLLGWLTLLGLGASSALGALQLPSGAEFVPVPALPAQPQIFDLDARGSCAVIWTDLGFSALTTDEGQTFRFVPIPQEFLQWGPRFYCADNRFFIARGADLLELLDGVWRQVGSAPGPRSATFRGVVQAPGVLYVGTGTHVLAAHDRAPTFTPVLAGVDALVTDGQAVFAAKNKEVYRVAADEKLSLVSKLTSAVRVLAFADAALLAATDERLFRSEDGGKSWTPVPGAPPGILEISGFAGSLIVTTASGTRTRSANGTWAMLGKVYRVRPGVKRLWMHYNGGFFGHVAQLGDAVVADSLPVEQMHTVRALAANGKRLVVSLYRPASVHVSADSGKTWQSACPDTRIDHAVLDGNRLQLAAFRSSTDVKKCGTPGLKTRFVPTLPEETCNGDLCVRFAHGALLRSRDRGKIWEDLTANLGHQANVGIAAAASGHEIIIARTAAVIFPLDVSEYSTLLRSIDDGRTFAPLALPFKVTAFAPGDSGWFFGTHLYGVVRIPYAVASPAPSVSPAPSAPRH